MGSGSSVSAPLESVPGPGKSTLPKQVFPSAKLPPSVAQTNAATADSAGNAILTTLQLAQAKALRCRMRPVDNSDALFLSQRACAQFMFRMPGVSDSDASVLKRMLSNSGRSLTHADSHCVFILDGSGTHEDLLCAAAFPQQRDCHRWQRAVANALANLSAGDPPKSSPLDAIFAAASAAKQKSTFEKHLRKSLAPVGTQEINTNFSARDALAKIAAISRSFDDAARAAAFDLELLLREFSVGSSVPDASMLRGRRIVLVASNARRSRGYAVSACSQFVLWYRPSCMAPLGNNVSFSRDFDDLRIPRISRPLPAASNNPALLSNAVLTWEGLYKQLCVAAECAVEALLCRNCYQPVKALVAPPLVSRVERAGFVFLFLQETPVFGVTKKQIGQLFGAKNPANIVFGLDSMSTVATYKPPAALDDSNLCQFTALCSRTLRANLQSQPDAEMPYSSSYSSAASGSIDAAAGAQTCQSRVDSYSFSPGLVAYTMPELLADGGKSGGTKGVAAIFMQPLWIEMPLVTISWMTNGQVMEHASLLLPSAALWKFCNSCHDEENHPLFGAVVSASCDVNTSAGNLRSRPSTASNALRSRPSAASDALHSRPSAASDVTQASRSSTSISNGYASTGIFSHSDQRWSLLASSSLQVTAQSTPPWAINAVKALSCCVAGSSSCVTAFASSVDACFSDIFGQSSKPRRTPCRRILELFRSISALQDSHGCSDISLLPMILKQMSIVSKGSLGVLYADLMCRLTADAVFSTCMDDAHMRQALQEIYSLVVDQSSNHCIVKHQSQPTESRSGIKHFERWWENSISVSSCCSALKSVKMLPLFQAEFGHGRGSNLCILESLLGNVWYSSSKFTDDSPKKRAAQLSRAEFYVSWIRAMAARTLQLLFLTEPIDWVDKCSKQTPSPLEHSSPLAWHAYMREKCSAQAPAALSVLADSLCAYEFKGRRSIRSTTFCELFCKLRFYLSCDAVSNLLRSRSLDDTKFPAANVDIHADLHPQVAAREQEPSDEFLPKPSSSLISLKQQSAAAVLDVGPLNFSARAQRFPLASTFGSTGWTTPIYISPTDPNGSSCEFDAGLDFINRCPVQSIACSSHSYAHHRLGPAADASGLQLSEPQSSLECMRLLHSLALDLMNISFVFDLEFVLNALADVLVVFRIAGSVHFDDASGSMLPLTRQSSQMCREMAATLYLRSISFSRLSTAAAASMFRCMCDSLSSGQAVFITRNFMPHHFRDFLAFGDVEVSDLEEHNWACVPLADALFAKLLNTHAVWTVELGFDSGDPLLHHTCRLAMKCNAQCLSTHALLTGHSNSPLDWAMAALACPLVHTHSAWLSACNPEAPVNDVVVISSTRSAYLLQATAQVLANSFASAIAASAAPSTPLHVSCVLVGYASLCCKFFGEWARIEEEHALAGAAFSFCPCQMLYGVTACSDLLQDARFPSDDSAPKQLSPENSQTQAAELSIQTASQHMLFPCMCGALALLSHHENGDKLTSYDPALLCFCLCPSRAYCDVSFKHVGQYCSDSTMLLVDSALRCRKVRRSSSLVQIHSPATLMSLNASSCMFVGDLSMLRLISQSSDKSLGAASAAGLQCLSVDGCLSLTESFMLKLSSLQCIRHLQCLVLPSFEQSSVLMGNFTGMMQQKMLLHFESASTFDEYVKKMKLQPVTREAVDQLGHRRTETIDPSLLHLSQCEPTLSHGLQSMLLNGCRQDAYSAHQELMGRFAIATAWCRQARKEACEKEAILFERNRTKIFAEKQWRKVDRKSGKVKSNSDEEGERRPVAPAIDDSSVNLWASNEKIKNVSVMMGQLEKMAQSTAVVRDLSSTNSTRQYISRDEVFNSVMDSFDAIRAKQDQSRYVSISGNLMTLLRQQKKDFYLRQLSTRARIRTALLHRHVRLSARLCVAGQGQPKTAMLMQIPSEQSDECCRHMLNLVADSFEGPGCNGESIVELLRCAPNLLHLSFVRAHPFSSSLLIDLMALRMSKTLARMRHLWMLWDSYKLRLGRMSFQRSIHYERIPIKDSIIKDHVGFHDRHCILASKYLSKLVFLDLGGLKHVSDTGRSAFFINSPNIQVILESNIDAAPMTNEGLLALACRALPPLSTLFPYLSSPDADEWDSQANDVKLESDVELSFTASQYQRGMCWSLQELLASQIAMNTTLKEREIAAKIKADQERKERLLKNVELRLQTRRNVLHCKAAIASHQGRLARLRWIKLNEMANFNPELRNSFGLTSKTVMAPETGVSRFGEPRYEYADATPSMLASVLLRIRFQVVQLTAQCCQTPDRIKSNLMRVKRSNRLYDDPFLAPEEVFGDSQVLKDPCKVFVKLMIEGQPDRTAKRVRGLRLSHDKYITSCTAGPIEIKSTADCLVPIIMRQTGYLVIPQVSSRLFLEIRCQGSASGEQMTTAIPTKPLLMPRVLDEPQNVKIDFKYAPSLEDHALDSGLQQAYFANKQFVLNGGKMVGYVQAELTVMSPWQADIMVQQIQAKTIAFDAGFDSVSNSEHSGTAQKKNLANIHTHFDPTDINDCMSLAQSSADAFPLTMKLFDKFDKGNALAELLLNQERQAQGDDAVVRCLAHVELSGVLVTHPASWEVFKQRRQLELKETKSRWDKGGFIQKFASAFSRESEPSSAPVHEALNVPPSNCGPVSVSLEGVAGEVDAHAYLLENRDQDSDFDDKVDQPEETTLVGEATQSNVQLMVSSVGRLVDYCVETVTRAIIDDMTFRRAPFGDMRHMRCLHLDSSLVTDKFFLDCFDLFVGLRSLSVAGCKRLSSLTMQCIAQSQSAPCLEFLNVSRVCDWHSDAVAALCNTARALFELHMDYDVIPTLTDGCVLLMSQNMKSLRFISLNGVQCLASESVSGLMEQTKYLGTLSIAGLGMMNDLALQYAHKCNFLTFLSISFAILVTDEGMRHISRCRQLQTLLMQNLLEVSDEGLVAVGSGCGRLQTLDVIGCERVSPRGTDTVVQLCPEMLTVYVDATPSMREWKRRVESNGSTSNVSVKLNFAASS